ncbi:MAG TPA: hypothetical protein VFN53_01750 [Acidobacteriaceae bacterium]|nr:hypothetical protein [Acidobacteriaceae bacterium]
MAAPPSTLKGRPFQPRDAQQEPEIGFAEYPRIEHGMYNGQCRRARIYKDPQFQRWCVLLEWDVYDMHFNRIARLPQWFNLGNGVKPHAGRRSLYFLNWCRANGSPPSRRDRLSPRVFTNRMARINIDDTKAEFPYSVVKEILGYDTGNLSAKQQLQTAVASADEPALP